MDSEPSTRRRRLRGVDVRPGSVREARTEAGLSLAQIAGADLTRAAIHLIETGRSRPSMPTLELIARRTGRPLSFFLEQPAARPVADADERIAELELRGLRHDEQGAIELADEILAESPDPWKEAQARFAKGRSLILVGRKQGAQSELSRARTLFEDLGDHWMAVECMDWEVAALPVLPATLDLAEEALRRCRALDPIPVTTESRILTRIGRIHLVRHESDQAIEAYEAAIEASRTIRDLDRMAKIYENMAGAYHQLGNLPRAASYMEKALALHAIAQDQTRSARVENNLGVLHMEQGNFQEAELYLRRSLGHCDDLGIDADKSIALQSLAELHLLRGELADSRYYIRQALDLATRVGDLLTIGYSRQLMGRLALKEGDEIAADAEFEAALRLFEQGHATERLVECHTEMAGILESRGDASGSIRHWRRAVELARPGTIADVDSVAHWRPAVTG